MADLDDAYNRYLETHKEPRDWEDFYDRFKEWLSGNFTGSEKQEKAMISTARHWGYLPPEDEEPEPPPIEKEITINVPEHTQHYHTKDKAGNDIVITKTVSAYSYKRTIIL